MTYDEAVRVLEEALVFGIDPSLEPIAAMCAALGDPQKQYDCVQITGTNGKTSTTRMVAALLHACGYKVGLYVSPHLVKYPERMEIDGEVIDDALFADAIQAAVDAAEQAGLEATEFELLTSAALWAFAHEQVDWAVLECGLGGRWDATSVVTPKVAVITGVALEHTDVLGDTIEKIAAEKAAIIKPTSRAVFAQNLAALEVFEGRAREVGAPISHANTEVLAGVESAFDHLPAYQRMNAATAIAAVTEALGQAPTDEQIMSAISALSIPGRFEVLSAEPLVIIDAAHNPQSAETLAEELAARFVLATDAEDVAEAKRAASIPEAPALLIGVLADKDVRSVVRTLVPLFGRVVATASSSPRSVPAPELAVMIEEETGVKPELTRTIAEAKVLLRETNVLATGSITVAGEVKGIWC